MKYDLVHVMNRGVDKRAIVLDDRDRSRFVMDLHAMNDTKRVDSLNYHFLFVQNKGLSYRTEHVRDPLVQLHAWILMDNHYHLLLSEVADTGISRFMQKLNMGYAKYFNEKYERSGALFQGKTKRVNVTTEAHYLWILHYIHLNALDLNTKTKNWRTQCVAEPRIALDWLRKYKWSSYRDYMGLAGFPELLHGSFLCDDRKSLVKETERLLRFDINTSLTKLHLE